MLICIASIQIGRSDETRAKCRNQSAYYHMYPPWVLKDLVLMTLVGGITVSDTVAIKHACLNYLPALSRSGITQPGPASCLTVSFTLHLSPNWSP